MKNKNLFILMITGLYAISHNCLKPAFGYEGYSNWTNNVSKNNYGLKTESKPPLLVRRDGITLKADQYENISIPAGATKISDSFYFEKLGSRIGKNVNTCGIVATQIFLGYYDTFYNDDIVEEQYDVISSEYLTSSTVNVRDFSHSPGTDDCSGTSSDTASKYHNYLCDVSEKQLRVNPWNGSSAEDVKNLVKKILSIRNIEYTYSAVDGNYLDTLRLKQITAIKTAINNNRPCLVGGLNHETVAFAYDKDLVWVADTWGGVSATPWVTFSHMTCCAFDIKSIAVHKHSDNYLNTRTNYYHCPCGHFEYESHIDNMALGYYTSSNMQTKNFHTGWIDLETKYWNTQSVGTSMAMMVPHAGNDGEAYIEFLGNKVCYGFDFNISFVTPGDRSYRNNFTAEFWALERRSDAWYWVDYHNLNIAAIPANIDGEAHYSFRYEPNKFIGFRIIIKPTSNSGSTRLVVSNMVIHHGTTLW